MKRTAALTIILALAGCTPSNGPSTDIVTISISGVVSVASQPQAGAVVELYRPNVQGLPELVGNFTTLADGQYSLDTTIEEFRCILVFVEVELANPGGPLPHMDRGNAAQCGANTINFDF